MQKMSPNKFVVKCGNFVVLVDLHILPLGSSEDTSWFAEQHKEEVSVLLKDAVDQRVKQYLEARRLQGQPKPRKELTQARPLCIKGEHFCLAAYIMKRHVNLRCIVKRQYRELRVFPERFVVCVSPPEEVPEHRGNQSPVVMGYDDAKTSAYFPITCETEDPLNSPKILKRDTLKKMAKLANTNADPSAKMERNEELGEEPPMVVMETGKGLGKDVFHSSWNARPRVQDIGTGGLEKCRRTNRVQSSSQLPSSVLGSSSGERQPDEADSQKQPRLMEQLSAGPQCGVPAPSSESASPQPKQSRERSKRRRHCSREEGEGAKKVCFGEAPVSPSEVIMKTDSAESLIQTSMKKSPLVSKSCSAQESAKTTLDEELLTLGKSALKPLFTKNNTEQTNQNRLTTSIKDLSVKPVSSHSYISSRSSDRKEEVENVPRKSRLRRLKKS
ncbi:protein SLX4IP isoform X2 [Lepisosteus oculatus]|nr:PREDICTED: protein SLX4IP isoform X2 [Lepisosteus oculatus]